MKTGCRCVVFPRHAEWRYCKNPVLYRDVIGRGWCWRHTPTEATKKFWTEAMALPAVRGSIGTGGPPL